jgi:hypothetical protein
VQSVETSLVLATLKRSGLLHSAAE